MAYKLEILPLHEKDEVKKAEQLVKNPKGYIVLVPGICHGAWCWDNFITFFADHGYQCYAVSLRGHGNSEGREALQSFTLSDYVDDVKTVVEMCKTKPVLVGHSMGGAVVQQYIGKYSNTVEGAVLFAPATAPKMSLGKTILSSIIHPRLALASFVAFGNESAWCKRNAAFFTGQDKDGKRIQRVQDADRFPLQVESRKIVLSDLYDEYTENYAVDIPVFVIGSYADRYFPEKSLIQTANKYAKAGKEKTALVILPRLCHDMMLDDYEPDAWKASAAPVLAFVENPIDFVNDPKNHWPRK